MSARNGTRTATTEVAPPTTAHGPQHLLDFARLWVGVRRRRRVWLTFALLGAVAGGLLAVLMPPPPTAVVRVLVVHEDDGPAAGGSLILTDVALITTTRIAGAALEKVGSAQQPAEFVKEYEAVGLTNNLLEVTVHGPTGAEAARRARALAEVFIADHVGRIQAAAKAEATAITDQRAQVQTDLNQVNQQISGAEAAAANAGGATGNAATLDSLYARRADLTSRISQLTEQAQTAGLGAPRVAEGTQIVDTPQPVDASPVVTGATNAGIGLLLGLVLGVTLAAVVGVVRDKPVLRRDIAENLGASVVAQLRGPRRFPPGAKASRERRRVAATLARLVRDGADPVSVLALGAAPVATALATDIATELAEDRPVALVTDWDVDGPADAEHAVRVVGTDEAGGPVPGEARIGVGSVAPGAAWTDLPHLGAETLLVVRAGYADTTWLHTVARQLAEAGIPVVGVVLVDPDPRDRTDGTLWDGLHTALRGRIRHAAGAGTNGANGANLPTKRLAPVSPPAAHDRPTTRFTPVRQSGELTRRRTQG